MTQHGERTREIAAHTQTDEAPLQCPEVERRLHRLIEHCLQGEASGSRQTRWKPKPTSVVDSGSFEPVAHRVPHRSEPGVGQRCRHGGHGHGNSVAGASASTPGRVVTEAPAEPDELEVATANRAAAGRS